MRSMVEGDRRWASPLCKPPSVSAARCHLPAPGRIFVYASAISGASSAFMPMTLYPASTWWISPVTPDDRSDSM